MQDSPNVSYQLNNLQTFLSSDWRSYKLRLHMWSMVYFPALTLTWLEAVVSLDLVDRGDKRNLALPTPVKKIQKTSVMLACSKQTLYHYDVMGVNVGTKWKIYMETCMFLCFHV